MALPRLLDDDSIDAAIEAAQTTSHGTGAGAEEESASAPEWRFVRHLNSAVDPLVDALQNTEGRLMYPRRDLVRGVGNGDLCLLRTSTAARRSWSCRPSATTHMAASSCSPRRDGRARLMKLAAIVRGLNPEHVEQAIKAGDSDMIELLRTVAADDFPNLVVIDDGLDFNDFMPAVVRGVLGGAYTGDLHRLSGVDPWRRRPRRRHVEGAGTQAVRQGHQASRHLPASGERGQAKGMDGMRYGGENEATYVVEVFRKCQDETLDAYEREAEQNSITVGVVKNKRPPSKTGYVDLHIASETGAIRPMQEGDRYVRIDDGAGPTASRAEHNAAALQALKDEVAASQPAEVPDRPMF